MRLKGFCQVNGMKKEPLFVLKVTNYSAVIRFVYVNQTSFGTELLPVIPNFPFYLN